MPTVSMMANAPIITGDAERVFSCIKKGQIDGVSYQGHVDVAVELRDFDVNLML